MFCSWQENECSGAHWALSLWRFCCTVEEAEVPGKSHPSALFCFRIIVFKYGVFWGFFCFKTPQGYLWKYSSGRRLLLIICHHMYFIFQELWLSPSLWCQESSWISLSHCTHSDCLLLLLSTAILLLLLDGQLVENTINHSSSWL